MKLECPVLHISEHAIESRIREVIRDLAGRETDSFAILIKNELEYVQTLWTDRGFVLEYQDGTANIYFEIMAYLSVSKAQDIFVSYLYGDFSWENSYPIKKRNVNGLPYKIGHAMGSFFGNLKKSFDEGHSN